MQQILLLIALALAATAAQAQVVFRSVMPDGSVIYGDKAEPGARESKRVTLPPPNISVSPPAPAKTPAKKSPAPASAAAPAPPKPPTASPDALVMSAEQELREAQAALTSGRNENAGDRIHLKGGGTRLSDAYYQRINSLEATLAAAQKKLEEAYVKREAAR